MSQSAIPTNLERFSGLVECYHAHRPTPPTVLVDFQSRMTGVEVPSLVVDLGCGTLLADLGRTRRGGGRHRAECGHAAGSGE